MKAALKLNAVGNTTLTGSSVMAPGGDINIGGANVVINEVHNLATQASQTHFKETSTTTQLKSGYVDAAKGAYNSVQTARDAKQDTGSDRMAGLATLNAAASGYNAYQGMTGSAGAASASAAPISAISVSVSTGVSKSESDSTSSQSLAQGSQLLAGGQVSIEANGERASGNGNLTMIGANVSAGKAASLLATGDINLLAAESHVAVKSNNNSSNASAGVTFALGGQQNGFSFQLGAQGSRGLVNGEETSYINTQIKVGGENQPGSLVIRSGGDTILRGANASADRIQTNVGGDLLIESLKDKLSYDSQQTSSGADVSICIPPICYGTFVTVNVNASEARIKADHDSVSATDDAAQRGQSGLKAGNGGFEVKVGGDTTLIGGVISSSQQAIDTHVNSFSTGGSLTTQDLANHSELNAHSVSVNVSTASGSSSGASGSTGGSFGYGAVSEDESSTTRAGISGIAGNQAVRTGDAEAGIKPVFTDADADQVNQSLAVQTGVTAEFGKNTVKAIETFTDEAYRVMFKTQPKYYKITCVQEPCTFDPKIPVDQNANIKYEEITPAEMTRLAETIKNGDMAQGKIVLAVNGILNGKEGQTDRAGQLAIQNTEAIRDPQRVKDFGETKPSVILLHYPQANNFISELMVAGYEKFLAGKLDYTNYDKSYANTTKELAPYGLSSEGHSRGTLVQENVFEILGGEGWQAPADMSVRMRGAPITQNEAESSVRLIGMDPDKQLNYFALPNDPVNVIVGGEKGDTGAAWREIYELRTPTSAHSCYGSGAAGCVSIEAPFSYDSLGKTPAELNAIREQRRLGQ